MKPKRMKSVWLYHLNTGGCNACDIEVLAALSPRYDPERFGMKLVESPRHADVIIFTGPVTYQALPRAIEVFRVARPIGVLAVGACACGGGIWHDSAAVLGGLDPLLELLKKMGVKVPEKIVKLPGCPPRPHAILYAAAVLAGVIEPRSAASGQSRYSSPSQIAERLAHRETGEAQEPSQQHR